MAVLSTRARKRIPKSKFGLPGKKTKSNPAGKGAYPMPDKKHAAIAKSFAARFASPAEEAKIDAKANKVLGRGKDKKKRRPKLGFTKRTPKVY